MKRFMLVIVLLFTLTLKASRQTATQTVDVVVYRHFAALRWIASPTPNVTYRVYRALVPGGGYYTIINLSPVACCTFTDFNVEGGQTYYYVITAIDLEGMESGYSNEATAVIPQ